MYIIIYKEAYVKNLTEKFTNMNWLSKYIFIITIIGSQKRYLDIGQNFDFKPFSEKKSKVQFLWKKFNTFFNTVLKNYKIFMEIEPRVFKKLKILQPYPP